MDGRQQAASLGSNPSRLVAAEQLRRRSPPRLLFVTDVRQLFPAAVLHDEGCTNIFDRPGRWEAALNFKQKPHQNSKAVGGVLVPAALP
jgi:hypothetical protein